MDKKMFGKILKRALLEKEMTQTELAKEMSVSRNVIAQWVNGNNIPPGDLREIAAHFVMVVDKE